MRLKPDGADHREQTVSITWAGRHPSAAHPEPAEHVTSAYIGKFLRSVVYYSNIEKKKPIPPTPGLQIGPVIPTYLFGTASGIEHPSPIQCN